ncbi:gephyrin-like molybdotransferase Glp [Compostimonas suwonensis]|uniref:Molybdopterin molybdenumtransferase n=1 Tax=Compostimonas suwonensis TaxID=1048394 RepID=A0A2M9BU07_9MICO|nr:gephyrin-like molybdotransferase Glp [Compostimonas suwonensis]PJJ61439.1 molybdopterin molybdotransferase [Compostimonas suwonensis]
MISVEDHAERVRKLVEPVLTRLRSGEDAEQPALDDALGRVLARDVLSPVDLPLFRNSQMDGYAVGSADVATLPVTLPVVGELAAGGTATPAFVPGTALRVMTGAPVPPGADVVVPVEETDTLEWPERGLTGQSVTIHRAGPSGRYVRERGSDLRTGELLAPAGVRLAPRHLGALAAAGVRSVPVRRRLRVAVLTTGAELIGAGDGRADDAPAAGKIFDANLTSLVAAVHECGAEVVLAERSGDDTAEFAGLLARATSAADLVLTSGGISRGAYEVVRETTEPLGGSIVHVGMQPGRPQATALVDGVPVLSFPGNPVSTQVSFLVFLRPLLREAAGLPALQPVTGALTTAVESPEGKRQFLRGILSPDGTVTTVAGPSSHLVAAMARANALIEIPTQTTSLAAGANVRVWIL